MSNKIDQLLNGNYQQLDSNYFLNHFNVSFFVTVPCVV